MEVKILEEDKKKIVIETDSQTIAGLIEKELWNDKSVKISGSKVKHPLIGKPTIVVETDGKEDAKKAVIEAAKRAKKDLDAFKKAFK